MVVGKEIYKNEAKDLTIKDYGKEDHITLEFGDVHLSINKAHNNRDIAIIVEDSCGLGVLWENDKYENGKFNTPQGVSGIDIYYLRQAKAKLETLLEAEKIKKVNWDVEVD